MNATEIHVKIKMDDRMLVLSCNKFENGPNQSAQLGVSVSLDISSALELSNQLMAGVDALLSNMWSTRNNDSPKNEKENQDAGRENDTNEEGKTTTPHTGRERTENR